MTTKAKLVLSGSAAALALAAIAPAAVGERATASNSKTVSVLNDFFATTNQTLNPSKTTIEKGDSVTWKWGAESNPHNVKFTSYPDGLKTADRPKSSSTKTSGSHKVYFSKRTGIYKYVCTVHEDSAGMRGKVVVETPD